MTVRIFVEENHPCWKAFDDDDWNGSTYSRWVQNIAKNHPDKNCIITLHPPAWAAQSLVDAIGASLADIALEVTIHKRGNRE